MTDLKSAPLAALVLRVSLGAMFLAHSLILKLLVFTLPGTADFFAAIGLPGWFAYLVFAAEAAGGALLMLGVQTRWVALALAPILAGAVALAKSAFAKKPDKTGRVAIDLTDPAPRHATP